MEVFQELKLKKKYKYILYKLGDNNKSIVPEKKVAEATYDDFVSDLTSGGPRYAVYDFDFEKPGEGQRSKIAFYSWYVFNFIQALYILLFCKSLRNRVFKKQLVLKLLRILIILFIYF